jgi:uncharacterized membrane protein YqjE
MAQPTAPPGNPAADAGVVAHFQALLAAFLRYFRARFELAGIESKEAAGHYLKILALIIAALIVAVFGYLFLVLGCVFAIARLFSDPNAWIWVALAVAGLHFLVTAGCVAAAWTLVREPMFNVTLNELKKDQEWLTKPTARPL